MREIKLSDTTDYTNQEDTEQEAPKALRAQLEAALAENKTLKDWKSTKERNEAFSGAGLDLSVDEDGKAKQPLHQLFVKSYDGKLDADAIKASATDFGVLQAPVQDSETQELANQHAAFDRASLGANAAPVVGSKTAALEKAQTAQTREEFHAAIKEAGFTVNNN